MEEFSDYWDLLPKNPKIYEQLREFLSATSEEDAEDSLPTDFEDFSYLRPEAIQYLRFNLSDFPFPTFQIVNILKRDSDEKIFDDLEYYTLMNTVENIGESKEFEKLYSMLANLSLNPDRQEKLCRTVLPQISAKIQAGVLDASKVALSLITRSDGLLRDFLQLDEKVELSMTCDLRKYLYVNLVRHRQNKIYDVTWTNVVDRYEDRKLGEYFRALKLCNLANASEGAEEVEISSFVEKISKTSGEFKENNQLIQVYMLELQRQIRCMSFLQQNSPMTRFPLCHFSQNRRILYDILENLKISFETFNKLKVLFSDNDDFMRKIFKIYNPEEVSWKGDELEAFCTILSTKLLHDCITLDETTDNYLEALDEKFVHMKSVSRSIEDFKTRIVLSEILLTLLFLKHEHVEKRPLHIMASDTSDIDAPGALFSKGSEHSGFMCSEAVIRTTLNFLKDFLLKTKRSHSFLYESETNKQHLVGLLETINDALYRLKIVTKFTSSSIGNKLKIHSIHFGTLLKLHSSDVDMSSSEEDEGNGKYLSRRRSLRKRKSRASPDSDKTSTTCGSEQVLLDMKTSYCSEKGKPKRTITKMLSSADTLAVLCANRGDVAEIKNIVKQYKLESTSMDNYVTYMEKFEAIKAKIFSNGVHSEGNVPYQNEFEAAKIESFAISNPIYRTNDEIELVTKYQQSYRFLGLYSSHGIDTVSVIDLLLSLPCSLEQNQYLYMQIEKKFEGMGLDRASLQNMGYYDFVHNLIDFMESFKHINETSQISIRQLLNNEFFSLNRRELTQQISKLELFRRLRKNSLRDLSSVELLEDKCYQIQDVFKLEINYFARLINFLGAVKRLLEYHSSEFEYDPNSLLTLDLDKIIGEIVTIEKVPPMEIEHIVQDLGINLVHVLINYALCPVINQSLMDLEQEQELLECLHVCLKLQSSDASKVDFYDGSLKMTSSYLLPFVDHHNHLAAQLVREVHRDVYLLQSESNLNTSVLQKFANLEQTKLLSKIYKSNPVLATLNYDSVDFRLLYHFLVATTNFKDGVQVIESLKEVLYKKHQIQLNKVKDIFVTNLIDSSEDEKDYEYMAKIVNFNLKSEYLNKHLYKIKDSKLVRRLLQDLLSESHDKCLLPSYASQIKEWVFELDVYERISELFDEFDWLEIREKSIEEPDLILHELLDNISEMKEVLPKWVKLHPLNKIKSSSHLKNVFDSYMKLIGQHEDEQHNQLLFQTAETLSPDKVKELYELLLLGVKNLPSLSYIVHYLSAKSEKREKYQKYLISIKIFECLNVAEVRAFWHLKTLPLLIIEQYLMNSKFEILSKILSSLNGLFVGEGCALCSHASNSSNNLSNLMRLTNVSKSGSSEYVMINYDASHVDEFITRECISSLLKTYASKALDFRISEKLSTASYSFLSKSSLEQLKSSQFSMPRSPPAKENWEEDSASCMSCWAKFSLWTRRHHCRRCGRCVCHACSTRKTIVPELYSDVAVRVCRDCYYLMQQERQTQRNSVSDFGYDEDQWQFTGNHKHDGLVRDEFSYEFAPSVNLCLSICEMIPKNTEYAQFLLEQAKKLEHFFCPLKPGLANPEIDYELVAKMVHCLALAAKMRGGSNECNVIMDHAEIIQALINNGCENLLPSEPLNINTLRKLRDSLIKAEQWALALEVSLKYHFPTIGVMASWGLVCLKAGCFMTAREKFQHCLKPIDIGVLNLAAMLFQVDAQITQKQLTEVVPIKRPNQTPGLILEILNILEGQFQTSVLESPKHRVLAKLCKEKEVVDMNENASNIIARLENLKNISQGHFYDVKEERKMYREAKDLDNGSKVFLYENQNFSSRPHDEALFYLANYASHLEIIDFLVRHFQVVAALRYMILQKLEPDVFINNIYYPCWRQKNVVVIFEYMAKVDETLMLWKEYILQLCYHLERKFSWRELYDIQVLTRDPVRASMTCIKFYTMNVKSYCDLQDNMHHLLRAQKHLEEEFELASHWEDISVSQQNIHKRHESSLVMKKGVKTLNNFLNTIARQTEVGNFLAACEKEGENVCGTIPLICEAKTVTLPTLFEGPQAKIILSVLVLVHAKDIEAGFGLSYRVINDFNLDPVKVYGITAKHLASNDRIRDITALIRAIKSNSTQDSKDTASLCDEILCLAVKTATDCHGNSRKGDISALIGEVKENKSKIRCFISANQLKSAYLLAVQSDRINDIRKILRQAELTNQTQIKKLCEKKLATTKTN